MPSPIDERLLVECEQKLQLMFDFLANLNRKRWPTGGGLLSYVSRKLQLSDGVCPWKQGKVVLANGSLGADGSCSRSVAVLLGWKGGCCGPMARTSKYV